MALQERVAPGSVEDERRAKGAEARTIIIDPARQGLWFGLGDLWEYRELLYFLIWRDLKVRYKQTVFGAAWAVLQPFLTMLVFTAVFGKFARIPSNGHPYAIFAYAALLPWNLFANALQRSVASLVANAHLVSKVYFPRLMIPLASAVSGIVDFSIAFGILLGMVVWFDVTLTPAVLLVPFLTILALLCAMAIGLWLSALNVRYRDVGQAIPLVIQIWMYLSPVVYSANLVPERWRPLYFLNPMVAIVEGFRWAVLGKGALTPTNLLVSVLTALALLVVGLAYFRRVERTFADVI